jgi:hypothetical protein
MIISPLGVTVSSEEAIAAGWQSGLHLISSRGFLRYHDWWMEVDHLDELPPFTDEQKAGLKFYATYPNAGKQHCYTLKLYREADPKKFIVAAHRDLTKVEQQALLPFCPCCVCTSHPWNICVRWFTCRCCVGCLSRMRSAFGQVHPKFEKHVKEAESMMNKQQ